MTYGQRPLEDQIAALREEGRMRAALRVQYRITPGGIERWLKERDRKRRAAEERAERAHMQRSEYATSTDRR